MDRITEITTRATRITLDEAQEIIEETLVAARRMGLIAEISCEMIINGEKVELTMKVDDMPVGGES